jgi:sec-independent protein translocase protein TatA
MGVGGISIWQLLIILVIVVLLFGTKRLKNLGSDLGSAIKGFRGAMNEGQKEEDAPKLEQPNQEKVIEGSASRDKEKV